MPKPRLLICGFGAFPDAPRNPAAAVVEVLREARWSPPDVEVDYLTVPVTWSASVERVQARLAARGADALLLVGVASEAKAFRIETQARNLACAMRADADGAFWPGDRILDNTPLTLKATAPVGDMAAAVLGTGLPVDLSNDAGDYLCNFTLYRLLHGAATPRIGFLHTPQARECSEGAMFSLADIETAVRAAAAALARVITAPA